jgi:hypothetical protein
MLIMLGHEPCWVTAKIRSGTWCALCSHQLAMLAQERFMRVARGHIRPYHYSRPTCLPSVVYMSSTDVGPYVHPASLLRVGSNL